MKALVISQHGAPVADLLEVIADHPDPDVGPGEVLVRTHASALNHLDLWVAHGIPGIETVFPFISGSDGCGVVEEVGYGVDESWVGRRVIVNAAVEVDDTPLPDQPPATPEIEMIGEHTNGCHGELFTAPVQNVLDVGDADPVAAAAYGLTHLTAWRMLVTRAGVAPGRRVLITGIGGGVALAALGICHYLGCETIVTSRHQHKLDLAMERGATHGVLDTGQDFSKEVRRLTNRRGVDICVDSVGKAIHLSGLKSLARGGTLVTCGCTSGPDATTDLARLFWLQQTIAGSTMGDMDEFRASTALFLSGAIEPVVDSVYSPDQVQDAYRRLESGDQFGKVVIDWR
jgi:NADPH2:quinone reductase